MRTGIMIAGSIDALLLLTLCIVNVVMVGNYPVLYMVVVIIADILLVLGSMSDSPVLLILWLIIGMIHIVLLFITWIIWPVVLVVGGWLTMSCKEFNNELRANNKHEYIVDCGDFDKYLVLFWTSMAFVIVLPIYYIYLWVVVKSHRQNLVREQAEIIPMH